MLDWIFKKRPKFSPVVSLIYKVFTKEEIRVGQSSRISVPFLKEANGGTIYIRLGSAYNDRPFLDTYYESDHTSHWVAYRDNWYEENFDFVVERLKFLQDKIREEIRDNKESEKRKEDCRKSFKDKINSLRLP